MSADTGTFDTLRSAIADRYALERELGRGGMATVFLARDLRHERQVALKVLHAELGAVLGAERFLTEIRTTANLQHPNILPLFDSGAAAGLVFYVMPYITGETLRSRLQREGQLSVAETIRLARGIGAALDYAHRQGVIHRDIKPENILLQDGQPLVADFGIALAVSNAGGTRITQTGLSVGTPAYMSPEQAAAERQLDGRSDQYSLASVLYEMLAGAPPFTGASAAAVMSKLMTEVPARIETARASVSAGVGDALARALEKVPADRFDTVAQFIDALGADASGGYRSSRAVPGAERVWKRRALLFAGVGAAGVAAALAVPRVMGPTTTLPVVDDSRFFTITLPDSIPLVDGSDVYAMRPRSMDLSADGRRLVFTTEGPRGHRLAIADLTTGDVRILAATDSALLPTFSPRGDELMFVRDEGTTVSVLWRTALNPIAPTTVSKSSLLVHTMAWHPRGDIFFSGFSSCLFRLAPGETRAAKADSTTCPATTPLATSASGGVLAMNLGNTIGLYDLASRATRTVHVAGDSARPLRGTNPMLVGGGLLVVVRDSSFYAARLDAIKASVPEDARIVLSGVASQPITRNAFAAMDAHGTLVWVNGESSERTALLRVAPGGRVLDTVAVSAEHVTSLVMSPNGRYLMYSTGDLGHTSTLVQQDLQTGVRDVVPSPVPLEPYELFGAGFSSFSAMGSLNFPRRATSVGGRLQIDSSTPAYISESPDGRSRCDKSLVWPASAPRDSVRLAAVGTGHCHFSHDGRWFLFSGGNGLFVAPSDHPTREQVVQISPRTDLDEPRWMPNDRGIMTRVGDTWLHFSLDATAHPAGPPVVYLKGDYAQGQSTYAIDPKGNLVLMSAPKPVRTTRINVLTNFPKYVEERLKQ